jgi:hypothetical protein
VSEITFGYKPSKCGNTLKQFQPSEPGDGARGTGNDSWYGKIEIDARKEMGYPQPTTVYNYTRYSPFFLRGLDSP